MSRAIVVDQAATHQADTARGGDPRHARARTAVGKGVSYVLRCLVGLLHVRRQAGWLGLARVKGRPIITGGGTITIGSRLILINKYMPCELSCAEGATIAIGRDVQINYGVLIAARDRVTIGDNVLIGNLCMISDVAFPGRPDQAAPIDDPALPIEIGDNVWLAARVTVMPGARIGHGSVIGAGSVVRGTIPPGVVAMGNPARPLVRIGDPRAASVAAAAVGGG